jgi:chromosome transmission fidelity protein 18
MAPSSPIIFPSSPVSQGTKRPRPDHEPKPSAAAPRVSGGFFIDDDEDDESGPDDDVVLPLPKKQMTRFFGRAAEEPTLEALTSQQAAAKATGEQDVNKDPEKDGGEANAQAVDLDLPDLGSRVSSQPLENSVLRSPEPSCLFQAATRSYMLRSCGGRTKPVALRKEKTSLSYEAMVASRSRTKEGRGRKAYYGIEIHELKEIAEAEMKIRKAELEARVEPFPDQVATPVVPAVRDGKKSRKHMLWTEKYRARRFVDLCGDDGTNRMVLRWLKRWDPIVFPGSEKGKPKNPFKQPGANNDQAAEEKPLRKVLLLTGPPGLGKTTLAHVCAKQAGYEVVEINASDDRSKNVVNSRIRTSLGTENVKTVQNPAYGPDAPMKPAKPVCIVVDEVDGVTTGAGALGEGGFIKALVDLILVDQKNSSSENVQATTKRKKADDFRQKRPLILICNDVYHPSLRPLRQANLAEIIHVGKPTIDAVVSRLAMVLDREGIPCELDGARKLCESAWGMSSGIDARRGVESTVEGDLRGIMVVGEWVAGKFRASPEKNGKLTRQWIEKNVVHELASGGARGSGRGGIKDIVTRVFQDGAGFPKPAPETSRSSKHRREQPKAQLGFSELQKRHGINKLREMIEASGDVDRVMSEVIADYPNHDFNDDMYLSKPNQAYDWLHFLDECSTRLYSGQEWELSPYLSQPILACHSLFAAPISAYNAGRDRRWGADEGGEQQSRFSGPRAGYNAHEAEKHNRSVLQGMQNDLNPTLLRSFRSPEAMSVEFLPYLTRIISPGVNPVVVGGGRGLTTASVRKDTERGMVERAAQVMAEVNISLQKGMIESEGLAGRGTQWVYRLEP